MTTLTLPARLTKDNVMEYWQQFYKLATADKQPLIIECAAIESIDAAGLALLLEFKHAKISRPVQLNQLNANTHALCDLYKIKLG